jgi:hypothetical protein
MNNNLLGKKFLSIQISGLYGHACVLTDPDKKAYCWGKNEFKKKI